MTFPSNIPNFIQNLFNGLNKFEFNNPKTKKTIETTIDQILISA